MKQVIRIATILLFVICSNFTAGAWVKLEYKTSYDNNFIPTVSVSPENGSSKTITSIEFVIVSKRKGASHWDTMAFDYDYIVRETNMPSRSKKSFTFRLNLKNDYELYGVSVSKVRYSDGTIREY